ncbi:MAG: anhydro-N-acetylmuramic acid kinase [Ekhidna sp.]
MKTQYSSLGIMAGSSMDGLDIVHSNFKKIEGKWTYEVEKRKTVPYNLEVYDRLKASSKMVHQEQKLLDIDFGVWISDCIKEFIGKDDIELDFIAIHGHTVIHEPHRGISWQLGSGEEISKRTGITTITEFRTEDISLGGQGAPLVPVGDFYLFDEFDACLNLGGIANISVKKNRMAWDISPCNQVLNFYASKLGESYDENGYLSRSGEVDMDFIRRIEQNDYFNCQPPKSLPNEFLKRELLDQISPRNGLRSMTEFVVKQIAKDINEMEGSNLKMLVTGGGAHNDFLVERIKYHLPNWEITIPTPDLIDFKEAIVFAFLGALRFAGKVNTLASVTGATKDSSSGVIHFAK